MTSTRDTASSGPSDSGRYRLYVPPQMASFNRGGAAHIAHRDPASDAKRNRSERSLRRQLSAGDLAAVSLAWGLAMFFQSQLRPDRSVAVSLAAIVSTLVVIKFLGLYQSWVCSEFSRQAARIIMVRNTANSRITTTTAARIIVRDRTVNLRTRTTIVSTITAARVAGIAAIACRPTTATAST